jgi:hypothetical protein
LIGSSRQSHEQILLLARLLPITGASSQGSGPVTDNQ